MENKYFEFINSVKINCGKNALETIGTELEYRGSSSPILLTNADNAKLGATDKVLAALDGTNIKVATVFTDIPAECNTELISKVKELYVINNCDGILAIGDGSVLDTAKGLRLLLSQEKDNLLELMGNMTTIKNKYIPFVAVPTSGDTGKGVTRFATIINTENNMKMEFADHELLPDVAILDARMTTPVPARVTAAAGMNALTCAIEAFSCAQHNPMSDIYALTAIKLIADNLIGAVKNGADTTARINMSLAATLAAIAFSNSTGGNIHAIGNALSDVCGIARGEALSIITPLCMEYNMSACNKYYSQILLYLGGAELYADTEDSARAALTVRIIQDIAQECRALTSLPCRLSETKATRENFGEAADKAMNESAMTYNPKTMSKQDVLDILNKAY